MKRVQRRRGFYSNPIHLAVPVDSPHPVGNPHWDEFREGGGGRAQCAVLYETVNRRLECTRELSVHWYRALSDGDVRVSPVHPSVAHGNGRAKFESTEIADFERSRGTVQRREALVLAGEIGERAYAGRRRGQRLRHAAPKVRGSEGVGRWGDRREVCGRGGKVGRL